MAMVPFTGVVLTGGGSTRMGQDKSLLLVNGRALTSVVAAALTEAGANEVFSVGGNLTSLEALAEIDHAVPDEFPGEGPLGGILTALQSAAHDVVVVLACDTPGMDAATPALLVDCLTNTPEAAVAYALVDGRAQPLTAAWNRVVALPALREAFDRGERAPRSVFPELNVVEVTALSASAVDDVDHPGDLQRYAAGSQQSSP